MSPVTPVTFISPVTLLTVTNVTSHRHTGCLCGSPSLMSPVTPVTLISPVMLISQVTSRSYHQSGTRLIFVCRWMRVRVCVCVCLRARVCMCVCVHINRVRHWYRPRLLRERLRGDAGGINHHSLVYVGICAVYKCMLKCHAAVRGSDCGVCGGSALEVSRRLGGGTCLLATLRRRLVRKVVC
jgi:hypothetical protein